MDLEIFIPNRFENLLSSSKFNYVPLIIPVEEDLMAFEKLRRKANVQNGGILSFILGKSGAGKTTSVYSTSVYKADNFNNVINVPDEIELRDVVK